MQEAGNATATPAPCGRSTMPEKKSMPKTGDPAPDIRGEITGDGGFNLAEQRGKWVVLYFFPRANTPG